MAKLATEQLPHWLYHGYQELYLSIVYFVFDKGTSAEIHYSVKKIETQERVKQKIDNLRNVPPLIFNRHTPSVTRPNHYKQGDDYVN